MLHTCFFSKKMLNLYMLFLSGHYLGSVKTFWVCSDISSLQLHCFYNNAVRNTPSFPLLLIYKYISAQIYMYIHTHIYILVYICIYLCITYTWIYVHQYMCILSYTIYIYTYSLILPSTDILTEISNQNIILIFSFFCAILAFVINPIMTRHSICSSLNICPSSVLFYISICSFIHVLHFLHLLFCPCLSPFLYSVFNLFHVSFRGFHNIKLIY